MLGAGGLPGNGAELLAQLAAANPNDRLAAERASAERLAAERLSADQRLMAGLGGMPGSAPTAHTHTHTHLHLHQQAAAAMAATGQNPYLAEQLLQSLGMFVTSPTCHRLLLVF